MDQFWREREISEYPGNRRWRGKEKRKEKPLSDNKKSRPRCCFRTGSVPEEKEEVQPLGLEIHLEPRTEEEDVFRGVVTLAVHEILEIDAQVIVLP